MTHQDQYNIPADKFKFVSRSGQIHDKKLDTKPVSYFQGAFRRFCKNKGAIVGAIVILCLVLFAIIDITGSIPIIIDLKSKVNSIKPLPTVIGSFVIFIAFLPSVIKSLRFIFWLLTLSVPFNVVPLKT